jgi:hypothetical protein
VPVAGKYGVAVAFNQTGEDRHAGCIDGGNVIPEIAQDHLGAVHCRDPPVPDGNPATRNEIEPALVVSVARPAVIHDPGDLGCV